MRSLITPQKVLLPSQSRSTSGDSPTWVEIGRTSRLDGSGWMRGQNKAERAATDQRWSMSEGGGGGASGGHIRRDNTLEAADRLAKTCGSQPACATYVSNSLFLSVSLPSANPAL